MPVIVNIVGKTLEEYVQVAERLNDCPEVSGFELNISCPNVKEGGIAFGTEARHGCRRHRGGARGDE